MFKFIDDKKNSWCAPSDCNGKIIVNIRELDVNLQDTSSDLTYDDTEPFLRFLDKYVIRAVGHHHFLRWKQSHQAKTLLDKSSASDIAYTILVYENSKEVWEEELRIKAGAKTDEDRRNVVRHQNPRYHEGQGKRLKRYGDGWTHEGRTYYHDLLKTFQDLKSSEFWETSLQGYWNEYQIKFYGIQSKNQINTESDLDDNEDEPEENWKVEVEESDNEIDAGGMSEGEDERRKRSRKF